MAERLRGFLFFGVVFIFSILKEDEMNKIKALIEESIRIGGENYKKIRKELEEDRRDHEKKRAQVRFFNITKNDLSNLKINKENVKGVGFNNTSFCLKKFLLEEAEVVLETNLEWDNWDVPITYPITTQLEIQPDLFCEIWTEATIFFKWRSEKFCVGFTPRRQPGEYEIYCVAKEWTILREFTKEFHEYRKKNHYLKGKKFIGIEGRIMPISKYDWDDIVLAGDLAQRIKSELEGVIRCAKDLNRHGLNNKKGFILAGDPGNGKTLLLKILANTIDVTCIMMPFNRRPEELDMPALFRLARELAPTILILEDIDLYGKERDEGGSPERLGELMNELDGMVDNKEIIVFATTNNLFKVEKALQSRPGRFDRIYKIMNPDFEGRMKILTHFVNKVPNNITKENMGTLAEEFAGYSGAYLKELINSGFAQAIIRDDKEPTLQYSDLVETSEVLKNKEEKKFMGFQGGGNNNKVMNVPVIQNKKE